LQLYPKQLQAISFVSGPGFISGEKNPRAECDLKGHGFSRAGKPFMFVITSGL
jgi:hypothetical protein